MGIGNVSYTKEDTDFILFYGNSFIIDKMPKGTRVIYPPKPIKGVADAGEAIEHAIEHPYGTKPFSKLLKRGMKVTIAFDDISVPLPPMKKPDLRQVAIELILKKLKDKGIEDIRLISAICLHRKMTKKEFEMVLGRRIVKSFYPERLYNLDAEDKENMVRIGETEQHAIVETNRRVAESDLVVYININFVSMDGGHKSFATGLANYATVRHTHNVDTLMKSRSYFDPEKSMLHHILDRQGKLIERHVKTFRLEMALNNDLFPKPLGFLSKRHYELTNSDKIKSKLLASVMPKIPKFLQRRIASGLRGNYELIGAFAGDVEKVHKKIVEKNFRQYEVNVNGQSDILIGNVRDMSPYSVNSILNPILFVCLFHGYFFNLYRNKPIVKKNGVMIAVHPLYEDFHKIHHPSYIDFYENILTKTLDAKEIEKKYERDFALNPEYIKLYRNSHAYHGVHPFYMWYWSCYCLSYIGKTIIVGAKSKRALKILNFDHAKNISEAIEKAKAFLKKENPSITFLRVPPIATVKVR